MSICAILSDTFGYKSTHFRKINMLTTSLAEQSPEDYSGELLRLAQSTTTFTVPALFRAMETRDLAFPTNTWLGYSNDRTISVGAQPVPADWNDKTVFQHRLFNLNVQTEKVYILSHEVAHCVVFDSRANLLRDFGATLKETRSYNPDIRYSATGSREFYKQQSPDKQAHEDLAELINMYLINPDYLKAFLRFLGEARFSAERNRVGLTTLEDNVLRDQIYEVIHTGVQAELR